jgi:hypothetical protein
MTDEKCRNSVFKTNRLGRYKHPISLVKLNLLRGYNTLILSRQIFQIKTCLLIIFPLFFFGVLKKTHYHSPLHLFVIHGRVILLRFATERLCFFLSKKERTASAVNSTFLFEKVLYPLVRPDWRFLDWQNLLSK